MIDPAAFAREQARLAHAWTFLGLARDVANDGDWITGSIGLRSVFVQRFRGELKGFENRCAHRFYPLRGGDKGNGPIVCGFHHWRYDEEGRALGIPLCEEAFGCVSRALDARLTPIELALCGTLIFGRFPAPTTTQTLEAFLGDGFPVLAAMSHRSAEALALSRPVEANWKLCFHISLDDYHSVAVHPDSFGRRGYIHRSDMTYARFGAHSAFLLTSEPNAFEKLVEACRAGTARSRGYMIFNLLPPLLIAHERTDRNFYYCVLQQFIPVAHDRTRLRMWTFPAPFATEQTLLGRTYRRVTEPVRRRMVRRRASHIVGQDFAVCERQQRVAHQIDGAPLIGALEERIGWFEQAYRRLLAEHTPPADAIMQRKKTA